MISGLVTGILSCTLLYFIDHNKALNKIFDFLNGLGLDETIQFYREQAKKFEEYACELENIDINQFKKEVSFYKEVALKLKEIKDPSKLNEYLKEVLKNMNSKLPWIGDFDEFMSNRNNCLIFE